MDAFSLIATNKVFVGIAILIMNIGSRFVIMDVGKMHEKLLSNAVFKKVVVFCMFFVATRDIMTSMILTFAFIILLDGIMNKNSRFHLFSLDVAATSPAAPTPEQYHEALSIVEKFEKLKTKQ
jgi:hypothetical protein